MEGYMADWIAEDLEAAMFVLLDISQGTVAPDVLREQAKSTFDALGNQTMRDNVWRRFMDRDALEAAPQ